MSDLGKYWASTASAPDNHMVKHHKIPDCHRIDIAGVASSILATPTTENPGNQRFPGFLFGLYAGVDWYDCTRVLVGRAMRWLMFMR